MRISILLVLALFLSACVTDGYYEESYYQSSAGYNGVYSDDYYSYDNRYGYDHYNYYDVTNRYDPSFGLFWGWDHYSYAPYRRGYYVHGFDPFYNPYYAWNGFSYGYGWPYSSFASAYYWPYYGGYWRPYRHNHHDHDGRDSRRRAHDGARGVRDGLPAPYANSRGRQTGSGVGYGQSGGSYRRSEPRYSGYRDSGDSRDRTRQLSRDLGQSRQPHSSRAVNDTRSNASGDYQSRPNVRQRAYEIAPTSRSPAANGAPTQRSRSANFDRSGGERRYTAPQATSNPRSSNRGSSQRPSAAPVQRARSLPAPSASRSSSRSSAPARSAPVQRSRDSGSRSSGRESSRGNRDKD